MAERRMFSRSVINSARFLRMPQTSRLLYYDLGMAADDDGVVEAFAVLRTTGAAEDDLRVLASKGFVIVLNEDMVTVITDWKRNNYIQKDRYHPSIYKELLAKLADGGVDTASIQVASGMDAQVRLGEVSIVQGREVKEKVPADKPSVTTRFVPPSVDDVGNFCEENGFEIDPERFVDYYSQQGWRLSNGNAMKDWRAAVRIWAKRDRGRRSTVPSDSDYEKGW